jgi:hypothetical protein
MDEKKSNLKHFSDVLIFVSSTAAVIAVIIPIAGFGFFQGYFSVFGIGGGIFPVDLTELWGESYYVALVSLLWALKNYHWLGIFLFVFFIFTLVIVLSIIFVIGKEKLQAIFNHIEQKKEKRDFAGTTLILLHDVFEDYSWTISFIFYFGVALVISFLTLVQPYKKGQEEAEKYFLEYKTHKCDRDKWSRCVIVRERDNPDVDLYSGMLIGATKKYFAIFDGEKTMIIPRLTTHIVTINHIMGDNDN